MMTLGALGGTAKPLTRAEILALPPVITLVTLGRALGVSEPVIRERARRGEIERMGIRVLRLGAQYRIPTADVWQLLGLDPPGTAAGGTSPKAPPATTSEPTPPLNGSHHDDTPAPRR
jgi:hypothetical protein